MKAKRIFTILLCVISLFSLVGCIDMGEGEEENSFHKYFSGVWLFSDKGLSRRTMATFSEDISDNSNQEMKEVIPMRNYTYIAFRVAKGYTLTVSEFACHAKTDGNAASLRLDFYITQAVPSKVDNSNGEQTRYPTDLETEEPEYDDQVHVAEKDDEGNDVDREDEVSEQDALTNPAYATTNFHVTQSWDSTLLAFERSQTVEEGWFIVIQARNNCAWVAESLQPVSFTINYPLFYFSKVVKKD